MACEASIHIRLNRVKDVGRLEMLRIRWIEMIEGSYFNASDKPGGAFQVAVTRTEFVAAQLSSPSPPGFQPNTIHLSVVEWTKCDTWHSYSSVNPSCFLHW
jgi:hypothetical protein